MSFNGLKTIKSTIIQNQLDIKLGNTLDSGSVGQALVSGGPNQPCRWDIHTGTIQPLTMGTNVSLASGNPDFDGSIPDTLNSVDTTYTAGNGIQISGSNIIQTKTDNQTIRDSGGKLEVIKVPNSLTMGTNILLTSGNPDFDGSIPETINLNSNLTNIDTLSFTNTINPTAIIGNVALNNPTGVLFCDLTSSSNITSPYFLHDVYDPSVTDIDNLSTSYNFIFSSNLKNSFIAKQTSCCIELLIYNYSITGNKFLYLQLGDNVGTEWSIGTSGGGSGTGTRSTARISLYTDETDKAQVIQTWYLSGLTIGTSYTINPMARTSGTTNYIYAGGSYPACILRGYYLPS